MQNATLQQVSDEQLEFMMDCEEIGFNYARIMFEEHQDEEDWYEAALEGPGAFVHENTMADLEFYGLLDDFIAKHGREPDLDHVCYGIELCLDDLYPEIKESLEELRMEMAD